MRSTRGLLALVAILSLALATVLSLAVTDRGPFSDGPVVPPAAASSAPTAGGRPTGPVVPAGADPGARFLDAYVEEDGRVVRRDQGGDTVSEGQAYAMLLAVAGRDERTFDRVWAWTQEHLERPDGLLSWTWRDGAVVDPNSASDADVDAAHALVVAGRVFDRPELTAQGESLGRAVLEHETRTTPLGRVLVAGQWAATEPLQVNPSYGSPTAYRVLGAATGDPRWRELAEGDRAVVERLLDRAPLPPDWAQVRPDGTVEAMPPPGGGAVDYGLDAQRIAVRYGASCAPTDRAVTDRIGRSLPTAAGEVRGRYDLGGGPRVDWQHPMSLVATAAFSDVDGRSAATRALLDAAADLDVRASTYYGAAWSALGEVFLEDPTALGITCSPEETR